jgi:hypothetical protein
VWDAGYVWWGEVGGGKITYFTDFTYHAALVTVRVRPEHLKRQARYRVTAATTAMVTDDVAAIVAAVVIMAVIVTAEVITVAAITVAAITVATILAAAITKGVGPLCPTWPAFSECDPRTEAIRVLASGWREISTPGLAVPNGGYRHDCRRWLSRGRTARLWCGGWGFSRATARCDPGPSVCRCGCEVP